MRSRQSDAEMTCPSYTVEHLATFGYGPNFGLNNLADGIRKLKHMELTHAIWAQRMILRLKRDAIVVEDENMEIVEAFPLNLVSEVTAHLSSDSSSSRDIYNNLLVFIVRENNARPVNDSNSNKSQHQLQPKLAFSEMHIFQCVRISAEEAAADVRQYIQGRFATVPCGKRESNFDTGRLPSFPYYDHSPPAPVFPTGGQLSIPPTSHQVGNGHPHQHHQRLTSTLSNERRSQISPQYSRQLQQPQSLNVNVSSGVPTLFERDVSTLNRNFDEIERFVARIQQAAVVQREIEANAMATALTSAKKRKGVKRFDSQHALPLSPRQPPPFFPNELEFVDIFQKFKSCFNLLAKLKNHIHEPNAPELLHFLFTPFALILDACTWGIGRHLVSQIYTPALTFDAKVLLENSLTSREKEVWISLGDAWTNPDGNSPNTILRNCSDFVDSVPEAYKPPLPIIGRQNESNVLITDKLRKLAIEEERIAREKDEIARKEILLRQKEIVLQNREENLQREMESSSRTTPEARSNTSGGRGAVGNFTPPVKTAKADVYVNGQPHLNGSIDMVDHPVSNGGVNSPTFFASQSIATSSNATHSQFIDRLMARGPGAKIAVVTYDRTGQNEKELTVTKSEYLEVLDDSKKWWECRNMFNQIGYVPHTILKLAIDNEANRSNGAVVHDKIRVHQNGNIANGGSKIGKANGVNGDHAFADCVASKVGARGEFRYF